MFSSISDIPSALKLYSGCYSVCCFGEDEEDEEREMFCSLFSQQRGLSVAAVLGCCFGRLKLA